MPLPRVRFCIDALLPKAAPLESDVNEFGSTSVVTLFPQNVANPSDVRPSLSVREVRGTFPNAHSPTVVRVDGNTTVLKSKAS
jgi:hypothetical protein